MRQETKVKVQGITAELYSRRTQHEIIQVTTLLGLLFEEAKHNLVKCNPGDFARVQGEAMTYDNLIRMLTRPPARLTTTEE